MAWSDSFLEEVRRSADIVRYISEHVGLRKMGTSWKGLCPFHQEKTPSFNVRQEPPLFHCFGCGVGGDVFKFAMLHERMSFPEAVETLARRFGVPIPEQRAEAGPERKQREELLSLLEAAADHYAKTFWGPAGTRAREYLLGRGFQKETLERIRAGAAPDSWSSLLDSLSKRFPVAALRTAGLVLEKQSGGGHYDRFRNRAIFPIVNESGKVVAFGARALDGAEPKYLNSPESPVYQKSRTLYGLSWAREGIRRTGRVVLMEGYLDVARALEGGVSEAVATCGTALTAGHARLLRRFSDRVLVNFDQDAAGQAAARKSLEVLLEEGLKVQVVELPQGHDPDSYVKAEGGPAYERRLEQAPEAMEWMIRRAEAENDLGTPAGKAGYLHALLPMLLRVESQVERSAWVTAIADRGGLDERAARQELRRALAGGKASDSGLAATVAPVPIRAPLLPAEKWLLALLLRGEEGAAEAVAELEEGDVAALRSAEVLRAARALLDRGEAVTATSLETAVGEEAQRLLREVAVEAPPLEGKVARECVRELRSRPLKARMAQIQKDIARASGPDLEALLAEKLELSRQMAAD